MKAQRIINKTDKDYHILCAGKEFDIGKGKQAVFLCNGREYPVCMHSSIPGRIGKLAKWYKENQIEIGCVVDLAYDAQKGMIYATLESSDKKPVAQNEKEEKVQSDVLKKKADVIAKRIEHFPETEDVHSLEEFCEAFLTYRKETAQCFREADDLLQKKQLELEQARRRAESDQRILEEHKKAAEKLEREKNGNRPISAELQAGRKEIAEKEEQIKRSKEALIEGKKFLELYEANMELLKQTEPLSAAARDHVESIKGRYPDHAREIDTYLNQKIDTGDKQIDLTYWTNGIQDLFGETCYKAHLKEIILAVMMDRPSQAVTAAIRMTDRSVLAAGLMLCLVLAFTVSFKWIFLYVWIIGAVFAATCYYINRKLYLSLPWDVLRQCRLILRYDERTAEIFSRIEYGLPEEDYEDYIAQCMDLETVRKEKYDLLEEEMIDLDRQFKTAEAELAKEQNRGSQESVIKERQRKLESVRRKCQAKKKELDRLDREIREARQDFDKTSARYKKAVAALSGKKMQMKLQTELEEARKNYHAEAQKEQTQIQKEQEQKIRRVQDEIEEVQKRITENSRTALLIEEEIAGCRELLQMIRQCKKRIESDEYWRKCRDHLKEKEFVDASCHEVADHIWLLEDTGPRKIEHKNMPVVLLADYKGTNPAEDFKDLIEDYIKAIKENNNTQLVRFSVIDEFGDGGTFKSSSRQDLDFYGEKDLERLERSFQRVEEELKEEGIAEETIQGFNREKGADLLKISIKGCSYPYKMNYIFILPSIEGKDMMNHADLWKRVKGNGRNYGFVPVFLIPQAEWKAAEREDAEKRNAGSKLQILKRLAEDGKAAVIWENRKNGG